MRFLILIIILTGCKSYEFGYHETRTNQELSELNEAFNNYFIKNGEWPSQKDIDSLNQTNDYLKRFSIIKIDPTPDSIFLRAKALTPNNSSINIYFKLNYPDFEDPIQSLEMNKLMVAQDSGEYLSLECIKNLIIQKDIDLGLRTKLNLDEKRKFRQWEQKRRTTRQLRIQNLRTKETGDLKVGKEIFLFVHKDSTVYDYYLIKEDSTHKEYYSDKWSDIKKDSTIRREYYPRKWTLTTINTSDSTINIELWGSFKKRVKITDIDSLRINKKRGTFKIVGVNDTAHNTVFK